AALAPGSHPCGRSPPAHPTPRTRCAARAASALKRQSTLPPAERRGRRRVLASSPPCLCPRGPLSGGRHEPRRRLLQQPLGESRRAFSCFGFFCGGGGRGYSSTPGAFSLPVSAACVGQLLFTIRGSVREGVGNDGTVAVGATSRLNPAVMSPVFSPRHWLRFGTSGPKRRSRKRGSEVWSNLFLHTSP